MDLFPSLFSHLHPPPLSCCHLLRCFIPIKSHSWASGSCCVCWEWPVTELLRPFQIHHTVDCRERMNCCPHTLRIDGDSGRPIFQVTHTSVDFFPLWSHEGLKMSLWVFLPPRAWDMGSSWSLFQNLSGAPSPPGPDQPTRPHQCLSGTFLGLFLPYSMPPPSLIWNLKQIWMGRMKLIVNVILFPSLRPSPCLQRLKDIGSCDLKKIFLLRTIVSVLSSEFRLGKSEGQHWSVLCFYISVLTTYPRATSMQCCSCLDWEPWCGRSISKSFNVS